MTLSYLSAKGVDNMERTRSAPPAARVAQETISFDIFNYIRFVLGSFIQDPNI